MAMEVLFAGVRVRSLAPAVDWYTRLFGREPDIVPNDDEVMWRVSGGGSAGYGNAASTSVRSPLIQVG